MDLIGRYCLQVPDRLPRMGSARHQLRYENNLKLTPFYLGKSTAWVSSTSETRHHLSSLQWLRWQLRLQTVMWVGASQSSGRPNATLDPWCHLSSRRTAHLRKTSQYNVLDELGLVPVGIY